MILKICLCSTNAVFSNFEESRYKRSLSVLSSMEAHRIKMKCSLRKDIVPNRDIDVPPAPEKLSERRKQVIFPCDIGESEGLTRSPS